MTQPPPLNLNDARDELARSGRIVDASALGRDLTLEADVVIVGSGAGGGVAAEILTAAGLAVIVVEVERSRLRHHWISGGPG